MIRIVLLVPLVLAIAGCQTTQGAGNRDRTCNLFQPIITSPGDSRETVDQVAVHNSMWNAVCFGRGRW